MLTVNDNGYYAIGNRYFGNRNADEIARAYNRLSTDSKSPPSALFAGNRPGITTTILNNGLVEKNYDRLPKLDNNIYVRAQNILQRLSIIAQTVGQDSTLSAIDRAKYDAEFQQLKQQLQDSGIGNTPTATASASPQNANLQNLQLLSDSSNTTSIAAANNAAYEIITAQNNLFLQQGGKQKTDMRLEVAARAAYLQNRRELETARDQNQQLQSEITMARSYAYSGINRNSQTPYWRANLLNLMA